MSGNVVLAITMQQHSSPLNAWYLVPPYPAWLPEYCILYYLVHFVLSCVSCLFVCLICILLCLSRLPFLSSHLISQWAPTTSLFLVLDVHLIVIQARQQPKQPATAQEESKPDPYYCLALDEMSLLCDFHCPRPPPITKGQIPHCSWLIIGFHQHLHDHLQGDLWQHLL